jgi:transposase
MQPTVSLFVGLDYSQHAVQVCVLDPACKVLCDCAVPDSADAIDQLVRPRGPFRGAALEACTGAANLAQECCGGQD